jgi:hypothetical protein
VLGREAEGRERESSGEERVDDGGGMTRVFAPAHNS